MDEIVRTEKLSRRRPHSHGAVWNYLSRRMGVDQLHKIRGSQFAKAESYLCEWLGRLKFQSWGKDKRQWRRERYDYIFSKVKGAGFTRQQLNNIILQKFRKWSIDELNREELIKLSDWAIELEKGECIGVAGGRA